MYKSLKGFVEKVRTYGYVGMYEWLRSYVEMIGRIGRIRAMDGRFVSQCIEQWGIASGGDGALDAGERVARGAIQERVCGESLRTHLYLVELSAQSPMVTPTSGFVRVVGSGSRMRSVRD